MNNFNFNVLLLFLLTAFLASCKKPIACMNADKKFLLGRQINFASNELNCSENERQVTWDYGDGTSDTTGIHKYESPGEYTVTQTVKNGLRRDKHTEIIRVGYFKVTYLNYSISRCSFAPDSTVTFFVSGTGIGGRKGKWDDIKDRFDDVMITDSLFITSHYVNDENCIYSPSSGYTETELPLDASADDKFVFTVNYSNVWFKAAVTYLTE